MTIKRNSQCFCDSEMISLRKSDKLYQKIYDTTLGNGYSDKVAEYISKLLRYMEKTNLIGACHATASVLYVAFSEIKLNTEICIGTVESSTTFFDHSWILVDKKIVDLACYMPLDGNSISYPILFDKDIISGNKTDMIYGVETACGLDDETQFVLKIPFVKYMDDFPFEENGLWDVLKQIMGNYIDISELRLKYANVKRKYVSCNYFR